MLHGRWEYIGKYKEADFYPDTISRGSGNRHNEAYQLYNILSDSGLYQHYYADDRVSLKRLPNPWVVEYNTQAENFTSNNYFFDPDKDYTNEKKMFQSNFRIEIQDKPYLAYGVSKIPILELTNDKLVIQANGYNKHYKKHGNSL